MEEIQNLLDSGEYTFEEIDSDPEGCGIDPADWNEYKKSTIKEFIRREIRRLLK